MSGLVLRAMAAAGVQREATMAFSTVRRTVQYERQIVQHGSLRSRALNGPPKPLNS